MALKLTNENRIFIKEAFDKLVKIINIYDEQCRFADQENRPTPDPSIAIELVYETVMKLEKYVCTIEFFEPEKRENN